MSVNPMMSSGLAGDSLLTHLNTSGDNRSSVSEYASVGYIFALSEQISDLMITTMQEYMQSNSLTKALNSDLSKVYKEVSILDQFTKDTVRLPQIVVTALPADNIALSFGNRLGQEEYNGELYDVYGGNVNVNVSIELYDSGKPNVQKLADIIFLGFMQYIPEKLLKSKITIDTPKVRFVNASKMTGTNVGGEVYKVIMSVPVISEWRQYMYIDTVGVETVQETSTKPSQSLK